MKSDISVIVMAYNEAGNLKKVVGEIGSVLEGLGRPAEVVIVDDGSSDNTGEVAGSLMKGNKKIRVIRHETNQGLGGVYRTGFSNAEGKFITFFPADGQFPAGIIKQFLPMMDDMDMVLGYLPERKSSVISKMLSKVERVLYRALFGPMPRFQGVMMFRRDLLDKVHLRSKGRGWTVLMELILRASKKGCRMASVPTEFRPRMSGASKVNNLRNIWSNLIQLFRLRYGFRDE